MTGRSLREAVTSRVIDPSGLADTYWPDFPNEQVIRGPHAHGYAIFQGVRVDLDDFDPAWGLADGAMVATPADLNRYFMTLLSGRVVPPAQLAEIQRTVPIPDDPSGRAAGLGLFRLPTTCALDTWGHDGAYPGYGVVTTATKDRAATLVVNQLPEKAVTEGDKLLAAVIIDTAICGK